MIKLGTNAQRVANEEKLKQFPQEVQNTIQEIIEVLDECYGSNRNVTTDLGGIVAILESEEDLTKVQHTYHLDLELYEFVEPIVTEGNKQYFYVLYQISSDYAVAVISEQRFIKAIMDVQQ